MSTRLTHLGGVMEVTGSCHLLESEDWRVLLDCGMHQGGDDIDRYKKERFAFRPAEIDAVILSHAHLDHSGLLPKLIHGGFTGAIYCTPATRDLLAILLRDSFGLYSRDLEHENLRRRRAGRKLLDAAYTREDVDAVIDACVCHDYHEPFDAGPGLTVRFFDAGHILGSSIVRLDIDDEGSSKCLVYSGDLGGIDAVLMNDPENPGPADVVMMESTYGDRNHRDIEQSIEELTTILQETWERRGNVIIPAFAVGRTQEILFHLGLMYHRGELDNWHIFLDSPMAIAVTGVYDKWLELLADEDIDRLMLRGKSTLEEFLPNLSLCESTEDSMAINRIKSGAIIIAGSGMCTGGRVRHHIKHRIWNERNTMVFMGFQARGTLGRLLVDGVDTIRLYRETYAVKARIETIGGFSAHAGQRELVRWLQQIEGDPRVLLVHGEERALDALAGKLNELGIDAHVAQPGERGI